MIPPPIFCQSDTAGKGSKNMHGPSSFAAILDDILRFQKLF